MKLLIHSELERLLNKKIFVLVLCVIPFVVLALANYYSNNNQNLAKTNPEYVYVSNFPVLSLVEVFIPFFNALIMLAVVFSYTEEFRTGQIRLVMLRKYKSIQIFWAKFCVTMIYLLLSLLIYYVSSFIIGHLYFEQADHLHLFNVKNAVSNYESYLYGFKYYLIAFLALMAMTTVFIFLSSISYSTTIALGANLGFIVLSMFIGAQLSNHFGEVGYLQYISLITIQFTGIAQAISNIGMLIWIIILLCSYIIIFSILSTVFFSKKDFFL
ncbi:hypothetical protein [Priestia megaterium]|uniref:hypothetical protein n=1 Tax=Priestia megaterium TaxID=1404 RepID=UPI00234F644F|nr:hypothetical protein [Priestia megaterium]MDC7783995.1 hypothetical protein [Priestia megaterium]